MASTVRIGDEDKERLRRLQEAWRAARGERPTQQELLGRALAYLERHRDRFLAESAWTPLTPEQVRAARAHFVGSYGGLGATDVDDVVYGDDE